MFHTSIRTLISGAGGEAAQLQARKHLFQSRNKLQETALQTAASEQVATFYFSPNFLGQVLDYLLESPVDSACKDEMCKMVYWRDALGNNALQSFITKERLDVARRFLDQHVSTNSLDRFVSHKNVKFIISLLATLTNLLSALTSPR